MSLWSLFRSAAAFLFLSAFALTACSGSKANFDGTCRLTGNPTRDEKYIQLAVNEVIFDARRQGSALDVTNATEFLTEYPRCCSVSRSTLLEDPDSTASRKLGVYRVDVHVWYPRKDAQRPADRYMYSMVTLDECGDLVDFTSYTRPYGKD